MGDRILVFIDGSSERAAVHFQRLSKPDQERTFWAPTVDEAIPILWDYRQRLEEVSLEHDFGGDTYVHSAREDCGMEVVRWLEHRDPADYAHVKFIIHTWNEVASPKMVARLRKAGYKVEAMPFGMGNK